ncbi:MAG: extracellular matrix/biofilm biosynthesis regulator RemA family protein [Kosmotogaceae bacterium]
MDHVVNVGFESFVVRDRILAVLPIESSAVRRLKQLGMETGKIVNLTFGKKTKAVLITDSGHIIFSFLPPKRIIEKLFMI